MGHPLPHRALLPLLLPLLLLFCSCDDDPTRPRGGGPDLQTYFPTEEGDTWRYRWVRETRTANPSLFATREEVPPAPDFHTATQLLMAADPGDLEPNVDGFFEMSVVGRDTTESGAEGPRVWELGFVPEQGVGFESLDAEERLRRLIATRRPDLAQALGRPVAADEPWPPRQILAGPTFLRGGVIARTDSLIGTYGDIDQRPYWKFLDADLSVGATFTQSLAPRLGADVFLHGQVRERYEVQVAGIRYRNCVEMLYVLDFGVGGVISETGGLLGYRRYVDVGRVVYAPGLGPVLCEERNGIESSLDDPGGWAVSRLDLRPDEIAEPDHRLSPQLANLWPNSEGDRWTFRLEARSGVGEGGQFYEDPQDVPDFPSLDDLAAWLDDAVTLEDTSEHDAWMRLEFDGMRTTESGVTAQNLAESFWFSHEVHKSARTVEGPEIFLQTLLRARPDLRGRARELWPERAARVIEKIGIDETGPAKAGGDGQAIPFFLFGYAWEKTDTHIGTYGDVDQNLAWLFLEDDLDAGHEFSHQLVPALADDIWLYGRVEGERELRVEGRVYPRALRVLYAVDLGVQMATDEGGNLLGAFRGYAAGRIVYAPGVGPVSLHERTILGPMGVLDPVEPLTTIEREALLMEAVITAAPN